MADRPIPPQQLLDGLREWLNRNAGTPESQKQQEEGQSLLDRIRDMFDGQDSPVRTDTPADTDSPGEAGGRQSSENWDEMRDRHERERELLSRRHEDERENLMRRHERERDAMSDSRGRGEDRGRDWRGGRDDHDGDRDGPGRGRGRGRGHGGPRD